MSSFIRRTFTTPDAQDADLILSTGGSRLQSFLMISNQDEDSEVSWVEMLFTHDGVLYKVEGSSLEAATADFLTKSSDVKLAENLMQAVLVDINKAIQDAK